MIYFLQLKMNGVFLNVSVLDAVLVPSHQGA